MPATLKIRKPQLKKHLFQDNLVLKRTKSSTADHWQSRLPLLEPSRVWRFSKKHRETWRRSAFQALLLFKLIWPTDRQLQQKSRKPHQLQKTITPWTLIFFIRRGYWLSPNLRPKRANFKISLYQPQSLTAMATMFRCLQKQRQRFHPPNLSVIIVLGDSSTRFLISAMRFSGWPMRIKPQGIRLHRRKLQKR